MTLEPGVIVGIITVLMVVISNAVTVTVFVVKLGGKIDIHHTNMVGKIEVMDNRMKHVEVTILDLKNTDRRLTTVEERQAALAVRQGNVEKDNLLIREDLGKLHQGLDRQKQTIERFNDRQFGEQ